MNLWCDCRKSPEGERKRPLGAESQMIEFRPQAGSGSCFQAQAYSVCFYVSGYIAYGLFLTLPHYGVEAISKISQQIINMLDAY